jgi:hypothetical protein
MLVLPDGKSRISYRILRGLNFWDLTNRNPVREHLPSPDMG